MIAALGLLKSKALEWAAVIGAAVAAVVGFALFERRAGAQGVRTGDLEREVTDSRAAAEVAARTAREPDPRAALDREFGR